MDWCLRRCELDERSVVDILENFKVTGMKELEYVIGLESTAITRIMLASLIEQAVDEEFDVFADEIAAVAENEECCQSCNPEEVCSQDIPLVHVLAWTRLDSECWSSEQSKIMRRLSAILETLRHDWEYPCDVTKFENGGFCTWKELHAAAQSFLSTQRPKLSDCLEVIYFLRKRPYLNMTMSTRPSSVVALNEENADIDRFDNKFERIKAKYPIIDKLADPALVVIEPIGGVVPPEPANILATMAAATVYPLPSLVAPVNLPDPAGPLGARFGCTFQLANLKEAKTFAAMLRVALADANLRGGPGPPTRIFAINSGAAAFRIF